MKQFIAFVNKEFRHIFRDRRTMLIILGIPVVQILLFGFAINTEVKDLHVALYAPSPNSFINGVTERLYQSEYFTYRAELDDPIKMEESMRKGKLDMMVLFDSEGEAVQLIINSSDPNRGSIAATYATAIIAGYQQELAGMRKMPFQIEVENRMIYNPEMKSAYMFVPGIMGLVLMLICTMMTSVSIVREKERGTMEVLLASPLKQGTMVFAKTVPYLAISLVNFASILLLSYYVLKVPIQGSLWTLTLISMLYIFLSLAFGLLISTLMRNQINAVIISAILVMLPGLLLSGMIFPIENMPQILQWLSHIVPARWYIDIVRKVMIQGLGWAVIWRETTILVGMSLLLVGSSILNIKSRLE
ncbi:MAG: ABC transporter permease [Bacteroidota bacterium]|jgi:ABC-2 type transport system permease protein|nr:ABC transporter permease [Bacteroidota bacterium]